MAKGRYTAEQFTELYEDCKRRGLSLRQTSKEMGIRPDSICRRAKRYGIYESVYYIQLKDRTGKQVIGNWELDFNKVKHDEVDGWHVYAVNVSGKYGGALPKRWMSYRSIRRMERNIKKGAANNDGQIQTG